jgi:hypothetical protein
VNSIFGDHNVNLLMGKINYGWGKLFSSHVEVRILHKGANQISWVEPTPLGDCLLGVYFRIFLESYEQKFFKNLENSHHIIMLWFT